MGYRSRCCVATLTSRCVLPTTWSNSAGIVRCLSFCYLERCAADGLALRLASAMSGIAELCGGLYRLTRNKATSCMSRFCRGCSLSSKLKIKYQGRMRSYE